MNLSATKTKPNRGGETVACQQLESQKRSYFTPTQTESQMSSQNHYALRIRNAQIVTVCANGEKHKLGKAQGEVRLRCGLFRSIFPPVFFKLNHVLLIVSSCNLGLV